MGVTIESSVWEPSPFLYIFIFLSCFFSIFLLPSKSSSSSSSLFDHSNSSSFIPFQRNFLLLFSLASGNFIIASSSSFLNYALILGSVWLRVHVKSDSFFLSDGGLVVGVWRVRIGLLWCGQGTNDVVTVCWILSCALCR